MVNEQTINIFYSPKQHKSMWLQRGKGIQQVLLFPEMLIQSWNKHPNPSSLWPPLLRVTL